MLDALSDVLRVIRLSGGVFLEAELTAPWCINGRISADDCKPFLVAPRHIIASHFVAAGRMQIQIDGGAAIEVGAGELVLLPRNDAHSFGSDLSIAPMPAREVIQPPEVGGISRIKYGGGGGGHAVAVRVPRFRNTLQSVAFVVAFLIEAGFARDGFGHLDRKLLSFCGQ